MFAENSPSPTSTSKQKKIKYTQTTDNIDTFMSNTLKEIRRKLSCQSIVSQSGSQIDEPVDWRYKQKSVLSKKQHHIHPLIICS